MQRRLFTALSVLAVALSGCAASRQYFQPTERVRGTTAHGYQEAIYDLTGPNGAFGEAKIYSRGAYRGPHDLTVVHLAIEVHNTSGGVLELRTMDVRLDPVRTENRVLHELRPAEIEVIPIPPGGVAQARLHFELPSGTSPGEVIAFRAHWAVHAGPVSYKQYTPFVEQYRGGYGYGYYGRYYCDPIDPFCYYPYYYPPPYAYGRVVIVGRPPPPPPPRVMVRPRR